MSYDKAFYEAYEQYLLEPKVRQAHDTMLSLVRDNFAFDNVIDFGCGQSQEFHRYFKPRYYLGVDENVETTEGTFVYGLFKANYRLKTVWEEGPSAFVSLFSAECTAPFYDNYAFYNAVFKNNPKIRYGLVSGFYYESKKKQNPIGETGGIQSYQTLEALEDCRHVNFQELRLMMSVPSKMFGDDVVEVWKLFRRS